MFAQLQIKNYPYFKNTVINIKLKKKDKEWLIIVLNFIWKLLNPSLIYTWYYNILENKFSRWQYSLPLFYNEIDARSIPNILYQMIEFNLFSDLNCCWQPTTFPFSFVSKFIHSFELTLLFGEFHNLWWDGIEEDGIT